MLNFTKEAGNMDLKEYNNRQSKKLFNAIVFYHHSKNIQPQKYRGIKNKQKFEEYCRKKEALYINYYIKETKEFDCRVWLVHYEKSSPN